MSQVSILTSVEGGVNCTTTQHQHWLVTKARAVLS